MRPIYEIDRHFLAIGLFEQTGQGDFEIHVDQVRVGGRKIPQTLINDAFVGAFGIQNAKVIDPETRQGGCGQCRRHQGQALKYTDFNVARIMAFGDTCQTLQ